MYQGVVQSSPVKQMVASDSPSWWSINNIRPPPPPLNFPNYHLPPSFFATSSWNDSHQLQESWSQALLGGLAGEDDKIALSLIQEKKFDNWDQQLPLLSPKSNQDPSSDQCNYSSVTTGGVAKKAKILHTSAKTAIKVRKEKLGDRITALHQLVSPFGKTDTATVLLEAIGYIKFLEKQIEALSVLYMGRGSGRSTTEQNPLLKGKCIKRKGISDDDLECDEVPKKELRNRGLCLVPISCTLDVGSENNGADFWAATLQ